MFSTLVGLRHRDGISSDLINHQLVRKFDPLLLEWYFQSLKPQCRFQVWKILFFYAHRTTSMKLFHALIDMLSMNPVSGVDVGQVEDTRSKLLYCGPFETYRGLNFGLVKRAISTFEFWKVDEPELLESFSTKAAYLFGIGLRHELRGASKWVPKESCVKRAKKTSPIKYKILKRIFDLVVRDFYGGSRSAFRHAVSDQNWYFGVFEKAIADKTSGINDFGPTSSSSEFARVRVTQGAAKNCKSIIFHKNRKRVWKQKRSFRYDVHSFRFPEFFFAKLTLATPKVVEKRKQRQLRRRLKEDMQGRLSVPVLSPADRIEGQYVSLNTVTVNHDAWLERTVLHFGSIPVSWHSELRNPPEGHFSKCVSSRPGMSRLYPFAVQWLHKFEIDYEELCEYRVRIQRRKDERIKAYVSAWLDS